MGARLHENDLLLERTLWKCFAVALGLTVLWMVFPLLLIGIVVPLGIWYPLLLPVTPVVLTIVLFALSTVETRRFRELARDL